MSKKRKTRFNLDRLRISYLQPAWLWDSVKDYPKDHQFVRGEDSCCTCKVTEEYFDRQGTRKAIDVEMRNTITDALLGTFHFNDGREFDGLCFFDVDNAALYDDFSTAYVDMAAIGFSLVPYSLTQVDVALDTNFPVLPRLMLHVKDTDNLDMIVNDRAVTDATQTIENCVEVYGRSRSSRQRVPSLYFSQSMGLKMRVYNKAAEVSISGKEYITASNGFSGWRLEVVCKWQDFQKWLNYVNTSGASHINEAWKKQTNEEDKHYLGRSIGFLNDEAYKQALWTYCANRLVHFREVHGGRNLVSLYDAVA